MLNWDISCNEGNVCDGFSFTDCLQSGGCYAQQKCPVDTDEYLCSTNDYDPNLNRDDPESWKGWSPSCEYRDDTRTPPTCRVADETLHRSDVATRTARKTGSFVVRYTVTD